MKLRPPRDISTVLQIKALVGDRGASLFHVFELQQKLPKFAMYVAQDVQQLAHPSSSVTFQVGCGYQAPQAQHALNGCMPCQVNERNQRISMWIQAAFAVSEAAVVLNAGVLGSLSAAFTCLRDSRPLVIKLTPPSADGTASVVTVATESVEAAGEVVQELASYLQLTSLQSMPNFPAELITFNEVLEKVDQYNQTRLALTAEMADSSNLIKALVVKAEVRVDDTPPASLSPVVAHPLSARRTREFWERCS